MGVVMFSSKKFSTAADEVSTPNNGKGWKQWNVLGAIGHEVDYPARKGNGGQ